MAENKLYYFTGRNTPVVAPDAKTARARKKRGGDKIVKVRKMSAADKAKAAKGGWISTRKDGKSKAKSKYGKGRGQGPKRKRS